MYFFTWMHSLIGSLAWVEKIVNYIGLVPYWLIGGSLLIATLAKHFMTRTFSSTHQLWRKQVFDRLKDSWLCTYKRYQFKIQLLRQLNHSIRYILYLRSFCGHIALKALQRNVHASICCVPTNLCHCLLDSSTLPLTSAVPPSLLPCRLFIRSSCSSKALIAHLVTAS